MSCVKILITTCRPGGSKRFFLISGHVLLCTICGVVRISHFCPDNFGHHGRTLLRHLPAPSSRSGVDQIQSLFDLLGSLAFRLRADRSGLGHDWVHARQRLPSLSYPGKSDLFSFILLLFLLFCRYFTIFTIILPFLQVFTIFASIFAIFAFFTCLFSDFRQRNSKIMNRTSQIKYRKSL